MKIRIYKNTLNGLLYVYIALLFLGQHQFNIVMRMMYAVLVMGVLLCKMHSIVKANEFTIRMGLFILFAFVSVLWANDMSVALSGSISMAQCSLIALSVVVLANREDRIISVLCCMIIATLIFDAYIIGVLGLSSFAVLGQGGIRVGVESGVGINANTIGYLNALSIPLLLYIYSLNKRCIWILLFEAVFAIVLIASASRAAFLMAILGLLLYVLLIRRNKRLFWIIAGVAVFIIAFVICADLGYLDLIFDRFFQAQKSILYFFRSDSSLMGDGNIRLRIIKGGLELFGESPILGHGTSQFNKLIAPLIGVNYSPHNAYVQSLVSYGIFGLILWQGMYVHAISRIHKTKESNLDIMILILLVMWLFGDMFNHSLNDKISYVLLGISYARICHRMPSTAQSHTEIC